MELDSSGSGKRPAPIARKKVSVARHIFDKQVAASQCSERVCDSHKGHDADKRAIIGRAQRTRNLNKIQRLNDQAKPLAEEHPHRVADSPFFSESLDMAN